MRGHRIAAMALAALAGGAAQGEGLVLPKPPAPAASTEVWRPRLIPQSCARPEYPLASVRAGETGISSVRLTISETGEVTRSSVVRSSGFARLDHAATDGLTLCKFEPAHDSAGAAVASSTVIDYAWRLEDAAPDPWVALRALDGAGRAATVDLAAVPFTAGSQATAEQRVKILRGVQEAATKNANCGSIEQVAAVPQNIDPKLAEAASGQAIRVVLERWTITQCGQAMAYTLMMRFPEADPASYTMIPLAGGVTAKP